MDFRNQNLLCELAVRFQGNPKVTWFNEKYEVNIAAMIDWKSKEVNETVEINLISFFPMKKNNEHNSVVQKCNFHLLFRLRKKKRNEVNSFK